MKKVVLFSILVLNLAFGVDYTYLVTHCIGNSNVAAAARLVVACYDNEDGEACFRAGVCFFVTRTEYTAQLNYEAAMDVFNRGCYKLKHKGCCNALKKFQ